MKTRGELITAGRMGTALNLTKASVVILMEPIYNSSLLFRYPSKHIGKDRRRRYIFTAFTGIPVSRSFLADNVLWSTETLRKEIFGDAKDIADAPVEV